MKIINEMNKQNNQVPIRDILTSDIRRARQPVPVPDQKPAFKPEKNNKLIFIVFAVLFYTVTLFTIDRFSRVKITLLMKNEIRDINASLAVNSKSGLAAETVTIEDEITGRAETSKIKEFNDRASGQIAIYNTYSSAPQTLVAGTRFENPDGKIYRLSKTIIVPGAEVIDGKIEPKSIEARITADEPGNAYNIGPSDFKIPGFKGGIKYEKFYGRSHAAFDGGFVGRAKVVSEKDIEILRSNLENTLRKKLAERAGSELPEGFFIPENAAQYEFSIKKIEPPADRRSNDFGLALTGKIKLFLIPKKDAEAKMLSILFGGQKPDQVSLNNFNELKFAAEELNFGGQSLLLRLSGKPRIIWNVDSENLANNLAAASGQKERFDIFRALAQIKEASIAYQPRWWKIFPESAEKITIVETY